MKVPLKFSFGVSSFFSSDGSLSPSTGDLVVGGGDTVVGSSLHLLATYGERRSRHREVFTLDRD